MSAQDSAAEADHEHRVDPAQSGGADELDEPLHDLRLRVERIDELELTERVAAFEQINDELVRALNELDEL